MKTKRVTRAEAQAKLIRETAKLLRKRDRLIAKKTARKNKVFAELGYRGYEDYIVGKVWSAIRLRVFREKGHQCVKCDGPASQVHHARYDRKTLIGESIEWLFPVCNSCHRDCEDRPAIELVTELVTLKLPSSVSFRRGPDKFPGRERRARLRERIAPWREIAEGITCAKANPDLGSRTASNITHGRATPPARTQSENEPAESSLSARARTAEIRQQNVTTKTTILATTRRRISQFFAVAATCCETVDWKDSSECLAPRTKRSHRIRVPTAASHRSRFVTDFAMPAMNISDGTACHDRNPFILDRRVRRFQRKKNADNIISNIAKNFALLLGCGINPGSDNVHELKRANVRLGVPS